MTEFAEYFRRNTWVRQILGNTRFFLNRKVVYAKALLSSSKQLKKLRKFSARFLRLKNAF